MGWIAFVSPLMMPLIKIYLKYREEFGAGLLSLGWAVSGSLRHGVKKREQAAFKVYF